jgi:4-amino-4-deoxy-L-arabinose transferase-like glycosyltransferase
LFGEAEAWVAALVLASSIKVLWEGRTAQIDMLLTLLVAASMACFLHAFLSQRRGFYWLYFALAGLATLAKGPVGFLPPLLSIVVFLLLSGRRDVLRQMRIGRGCILWAAIVAAWLLAAAATAGWGYLNELVLRQNFARFFTPESRGISSGHLRPWYHYLQTLAVDFLPWSVFLPAACWVAWREGAWRREPGLRFAASWVIVTVGFLSLSPAKRSVYLLPIFPALALLVAHHVRLVRSTWPRHRLTALAPPLLIAAIAATAAVLLPTVLAERPEVAMIGRDSALLLAVIAGIVALGASTATVLAARNRQFFAAVLVAAAMLPIGPVVLGQLLPRADPLKSGRALSEELLAQLGPGERYGLFRSADGRILFYTGRFATVLRSERSLRRFADEGEGRWVVARREDLQAIREPIPYEEVMGDARQRGGYVLLRAHPAGSP